MMGNAHTNTASTGSSVATNLPSSSSSNNNNPTTPLLDVLLVGAGQAGMAAAHHLLSQQSSSATTREATNNAKTSYTPPIQLHVVEATDHIGGRTRNWDLAAQRFDTATADAVELGGTWLSPNHTAVRALCRELGIDIYSASFLEKNEDVQEEVATATTNNTSANTTTTAASAEWPWWYWGSDFAEQERMHTPYRTIMHHASSSNNNKSHRRLLFRNPDELLPQLDPNCKEELDQLGNYLDDILSTHNSSISWDAKHPGKDWGILDRDSTAGRLMPRLSTPDARNILRNAIHNKNAQEPDQVSFLYNLFSWKGCNSDGPDSEYRVLGGTQAIPLAIAKRYEMEPTLNDPVVSITVLPHENKISGDDHHPQLLQTKTSSGKVLVSKTVILTGSPSALQGIHFRPPWPAAQAQLLQRMPMGTSCKFMAIYNQGPWWRKLGLSGDVISSHLPEELSVPIIGTTDDDGNNNSNGTAGDKTSPPPDRIPIFGQCFDTSPFSRNFGVLTCFVEGRSNLHVSRLTREQQRELLHEFLQLSFSNLTATTAAITDDSDSKNNNNKPIWEPDDFVVYNWADDPYVRGAYTAYFPPGVLSVPEWWEAYRDTEKLPNVFLAGSDYHAGFGNGYIEGAVRSGQQAAQLVLERLNEMRQRPEQGSEEERAEDTMIK